MMTYPGWLQIVLALAIALAEYFQRFATNLDANAMLILGAVQVAVGVLLAFQKQTANTLRRMQGKPTVA
jgi:hypothetical protein